jgi:hypothetical protein
MRHTPTYRKPSALVALGLALALLAASCGGDDDTTASTTTSPTTTEATTTAAPTTTTAVTTTTTAAPTTTTAAPTTTTTQATTTTVDTNALASGSGCTPGTDVLPDGEWFGYVDSATAEVLEFDLACWFTGDAAILAAAEDGEESPPPNDYYIRNVNPDLREVPVAADAEVMWLPNLGGPDLADITYADWIAARYTPGTEGEYKPGVWLTIADGEIVEIQEQYVP